MTVQRYMLPRCFVVRAAPVSRPCTILVCSAPERSILFSPPTLPVSPSLPSLSRSLSFLFSASASQWWCVLNEVRSSRSGRWRQRCLSCCSSQERLSFSSLPSTAAFTSAARLCVFLSLSSSLTFCLLSVHLSDLPLFLSLSFALSLSPSLPPSLIPSLSLSLSLYSSDGEDHHVETERQRRQQQNRSNGKPHMEQDWTAAVVSLRSTGLPNSIFALLRTWPLGLSNAHLDCFPLVFCHSLLFLPSTVLIPHLCFFSLTVFHQLISNHLSWNSKAPLLLLLDISPS